MYITFFLKTNKLKPGTSLVFQGCHLTLNATGSQVPPEILSSCAKGMTFGKITCVLTGKHPSEHFSQASWMQLKSVLRK